MTVNPYSPPTDPPDSRSGQSWFKQGDEGLARIYEFQMDASIAAIRARRASSLHSVFDGVMVVVTLILCAAFFPFWKGASSLFCAAFPIWFFLGIAWLANFTFRRGDDFAATCPGLVGNITGRFSLRQIELRGPEICMACDVTGKQVRLGRQGITIKVPGTEQVLQILDRDIIQTVDSEDGRWWDDVGEGLLGDSGLQALAEGNAFVGERQLHGRDLVGLSPNRRQRKQAVISGGLTCLVLVLAFLIYLQIPPRVFGYKPIDIKRMPYNQMIVAMYCLVFCSLPLAAFCIGKATKSFRAVGKFNIAVSPTVVSVAKIRQKDRAGLTGAGLDQVRWTGRGLQIVGKKDRLLFLMPSHWFNDDQKSWLAESYGREVGPILRDCYFGPRLG